MLHFFRMAAEAELEMEAAEAELQMEAAEIRQLKQVR